MIAALYIDALGIYGKLPGVDPWDVTRDARKYDGPWPVVAHPPCKHWGRLAHLATCARCLGCGEGFTASQIDEFRSGNHLAGCGGAVLPESDADCAPRAVEQVRAYGGVLEHPAGSKLWEACGLPAAERFDWVFEPALLDAYSRDAHGGYTIEIDQCEWGHVARKRTWLYLVGVPREALEAPPFPGREPTHWISGGRGRQGKKAKTTPVPPGIKVASAQQRRRTPQLLAEYLVRLARSTQQEQRRLMGGAG